MINVLKGISKSQNDILFEKENLKRRIDDVVNKGCSNDPSGCPFKICGFNGRCHRDDYSYDNLRQGLHKLKSIFKNLSKRSNKANGYKNPRDLGEGVFEIAASILGCDVFEHSLIKGNKLAIKEMSRATTLNQITTIFNRQYNIKFKKSKKIFKSFYY